MSIFPVIAVSASDPGAESLPLARECAWNFELNKPIFAGGDIVEVSGIEAVKVWIFKALHTERFRYEIYSRGYGSDVFSLIGQPFSLQLKHAEAARYVKECLIINKYITSVSNINVDFSDNKLTISCYVSTIYGSEEIITDV